MNSNIDTLEKFVINELLQAKADVGKLISKNAELQKENEELKVNIENIHRLLKDLLKIEIVQDIEMPREIMHFKPIIINEQNEEKLIYLDRFLNPFEERIFRK